MHTCIVCSKTIPEETIIRICGKMETKIDGKAQTIGNIICRVFMESTIAGIRQKYICNLCSIDNWKFTEHGVLMNETPVED